jgi:hypothetical protein
LKYEHEGYLELEKGMPRKGEFCETPSGRGKVTDRNLLTRKVSVTFENGNVAVFHVDDVKVVPHDRRRENNTADSGENDKEPRAERGEHPHNHHGKRRKNGGSDNPCSFLLGSSNSVLCSVAAVNSTDYKADERANHNRSDSNYGIPHGHTSFLIFKVLKFYI